MTYYQCLDSIGDLTGPEHQGMIEAFTYAGDHGLWVVCERERTPTTDLERHLWVKLPGTRSWQVATRRGFTNA